MKPMRIETKKDALLHCFDLWLWCAVTGKDKEEWPGWKMGGGYLEHCECFCPVCEYVKDDSRFPDGGSCRHNCLIKWSGPWCESLDSEFFKWRGSETKKDRKKWALEIAILAVEAM